MKSSTSNKSKSQDFRQDVLALHRAIYRSNQQRISQAVFGYGASFRRYELEYLRGVKRFQGRAEFSELNEKLNQAQIVYVGDYHTLAQAQRSFLRVLRRIEEGKSVTIALEFFAGRFQKEIDRFLADQLGEEEFLAAIRYDESPGFGSWAGMKPIVDLAKQRQYSVIGIDSAAYGAGGDSLRKRDSFAAERIARARKQRPDDLIVVLMGELHLAPEHLPAMVEKACGSPLEKLVVYQNCHEIYWQLEAKGLEQDVELVRISENQFCLMNTPPIVCQQSFLNWIEADDGLVSEEAPEENFKKYARMIAALFDLPLGEQLDDLELTSVVDLSFLARLKRRGDFSAADIRQIRRQILRSESYFIPRARMVYLGNLSVNHAAEEATHFLRFICSESVEPKYLIDAFYARILEEALGFMGSKLVNHKRKCPQVRDLARMGRSTAATPAERELARLVLLHIRMEQGEKVRGMKKVYGCGPDMFNAVTHVIGYRLGERLYYALLQGLITKDWIRVLFFDRFDDEGEALTTYLQLIMQVRDVRIPDRF